MYLYDPCTGTCTQEPSLSLCTNEKSLGAMSNTIKSTPGLYVSTRYWAYPNCGEGSGTNFKYTGYTVHTIIVNIVCHAHSLTGPGNV